MVDEMYVNFYRQSFIFFILFYFLDMTMALLLLLLSFSCHNNPIAASL